MTDFAYGYLSLLIDRYEKYRLDQGKVPDAESWAEYDKIIELADKLRLFDQLIEHIEKREQTELIAD